MKSNTIDFGSLIDITITSPKKPAFQQFGDIDDWVNKDNLIAHISEELLDRCHCDDPEDELGKSLMHITNNYYSFAKESIKTFALEATKKKPTVALPPKEKFTLDASVQGKIGVNRHSMNTEVDFSFTVIESGYPKTVLFSKCFTLTLWRGVKLHDVLFGMKFDSKEAT